MSARPTRCARRRAGTAAAGVEREADEAPGDPPVAAVLDADDHFLADVAALAPRDGAILETGLERNRVRVHVDAEARTAALDAHGLDVGLARREQRRRRRAPTSRLRDRGVDDDVEPGDARVVAAHEDGVRAGDPDTRALRTAPTGAPPSMPALTRTSSGAGP